MNFMEWKAALQSSVSYIRSDAAETTPDDGDDQEIVELLSFALTDPDPLVRTCAAESLGNCHMDTARSALRTAIANEKVELPMAFMLCSLGMIGEPIDYDVLTSRFADNNNSQRIAISSAEGLVHLTVNNAITSITSAFLSSADQPNIVGLPALERIVNRMNRAFAHIENVAKERIEVAEIAAEKEYLRIIIKSIDERLVE
jgi:HEAT repeats